MKAPMGTMPKMPMPMMATAKAMPSAKPTSDDHLKMAAHHALGLAHHLTKMRKKAKVKA